MANTYQLCKFCSKGNEATGLCGSYPICEECQQEIEDTLYQDWLAEQRESDLDVRDSSLDPIREMNR